MHIFILFTHRSKSPGEYVSQLWSEYFSSKHCNVSWWSPRCNAAHCFQHGIQQENVIHVNIVNTKLKNRSGTVALLDPFQVLLWVSERPCIQLTAKADNKRFWKNSNSSWSWRCAVVLRCLCSWWRHVTCDTQALSFCHRSSFSATAAPHPRDSQRQC